MRDVAELAGVGIKTVSRVVNDEPNVSPAMAERVRRAVTELMYQHNLAAGNLRRSDRRSLSIGLILANVANPFDAAVHRGVEDVANSHGVAVFSASTDENPDRERSLNAAFTARRVDGLIVVSANPTHDFLAADLEVGMSIVFVDRPPVGIEADSVLVDNFGGAAQAVEHLHSHGHRSIAFLGDRSTLWTARERHSGFLAALEKLHIDAANAPTIDNLSNEYVAEAAVRSLMEASEPPTALFAAQNLVTIGAIRALRSLGLEQEIALVGFDDLPLADLLQPGVTVIAQDPLQTGKLAAERIFDRINGDAGPAQRILVPTRFLVRGTGEIPPPS
ncbi:MAG: LacI family DNA-binding transcriptional regulator [Aeromicrobium sp.]